jgi:cytochrome c553
MLRPVLVALLVLIVAGVAAVGFLSQQRIDRRHDVELKPVIVPADAAAVDRGRHLAITRGCTDCHGADLGGQVLGDDGFMGRIVSANLTGGRGGIRARYRENEIARSIRFGVKQDGRSVAIMPAEDYFPLADADIADLLVYLRSLPPVDRDLGETRLGPGARALIVLARAPLLSAEAITPDRMRPEKPPASVTAAYGSYVAAMCVSCHGRDYAGGLTHGPPGTPPSANLTPAGHLSGWTEEQFLAALRQGRLPDGRQMDPRFMPWAAFAQLDDIEARATWAFLRALPPATR